MATESQDLAGDGRGQAKLLGECEFQLDTILPSLVGSVGVGVKKPLKFARSQGDKTLTVGRFVATFKIRGEYNPEGESIKSRPQEPNAVSDIDRVLPSADFGAVRWRLRIDARCATGGPLNAVTKAGFPSLYLQFGWVQYKKDSPSTETVAQSSVLDDTRSPVWNEQLLFANPAEADKPGTPFLRYLVAGFLWAALKDKYTSDLIMEFHVPLELLRPFQPVHLVLVGASPSV